jgi:hypothetical protein
MMGGVGGWRDKKEGVGLWMGDSRGEEGEIRERSNTPNMRLKRASLNLPKCNTPIKVINDYN